MGINLIYYILVDNIIYIYSELLLILLLKFNISCKKSLINNIKKNHKSRNKFSFLQENKEILEGLFI